MHLKIGVRWQAEDWDLDARVTPLLRAIAKTGSLNQAVGALRMSYRHAWGLLGNAERALGQPLVNLQRGRGAQLSPLGEKLVAVDEEAAALLEREFGDTLRSLNRERAARRVGSPIMMHASHDLALAELRDLMLKTADPIFELHVRGSLECLADLAHGACEIAGFHVPDVAAGTGAFDAYRPWLKARSIRLIKFVTRRQGLMVASGNPRRIHSLTDLADSGARFINRQPGSGTRLFLDHLLAEARIRPSQINGYQAEEFTHAAVAATIASGMADAGFGIEAAARRQGLDFVSLASERYFLAMRARTLSTARMKALLEALRSSAFHKCWEALPGYAAPDIGKVIFPRDVLPAI